MKKILLLIMCFMFVGAVNAKTLSIEEVVDGFNHSKTKELIGGTITATHNEANSSIDIAGKAADGTDVSRSYSYSEGYIHYTDDTNPITEEAAMNQLVDMFFLNGILEGIFTKSGYDIERLNDIPDDFEFDFDRYGISMQTEPYSITGTDSTSSGDYIRDYKIGFDTDKIAAFVTAVGLKPDMSDKVPTLTITEKGKNSVSLNAFATDQDGDDAYSCEIYRATKKNGEYTKLDFEVNCSTKDVSLVDENLKKDTTYYYKAKVVGGTKYSNIVSYTNGKIVNPDTGVNNFVPLLIGFILGIGALVLFRRNSMIKL